MINFDSLTLKAQLKEIAPLLESGRIQKAQQPTRRELLFTFRASGSTHKLYISINPSYPHIALLSKDGEALRSIKIPQSPPMFCMLLRKHMEGAKLLKIVQPDSERIIELYFDSYSELGERVPLVLAIELMGKHSNVILYNYDTNVILGCAHNISAEKSREREVAGTLPYIYPPKQHKKNLLNTTKDEFLKLSMVMDSGVNYWLNKNFSDISLALANEICEINGINPKKDVIEAISPQKLSKIYAELINVLNLKHLKPAISQDKDIFSLISRTDLKWKNYESVNEMVDIYFGNFIHENKLQRLKSELLNVVKKEIKRISTNQKTIIKTLNNPEKAEKHRQFADIIMANLHNINKKDTELKTISPYTNEEVQIPLDEVLSPSENAQKYYKLYNKAKNALKMSEERLVEIKLDLEHYENIKFSIEQAQSLYTLEQIKEELVLSGVLKDKNKDKNKKKKKDSIMLDSREINGFKVYIGKNNKQNDYIVSKLSSPNDIWLHAQEIPGSHVLIKIPPENIEVDEKTIYEVAKLAANYSSAKGAAKVSVIYLRKKFLKKPPGARPGYVTYTNEQTMVVEN